ncbi:HAD family hydrolase [Candidatus Auribacterota bacterium]
MTKYQHIIWDWNGTLFDDAWLCVELMNEMRKKRNMPLIDQKIYQSLFDFPVIEYYRRLNFDLKKEPFEKLGTEFMAAYEKRKLACALQPEVLSTLEKVKDLDIAQSILSAYRQEHLTALVEHYQLSSFFTYIIGLDNHYAYGKVELGKMLLKKLSLSPEKILFVGDTVHDYDVAKKVGTDCILIPSGHHNLEKLKSCGVPVIASLRGLCTLLS